MIHSVVPVIANALDEFIRNELGLQENIVQVSSLVGMQGEVSPGVQNKIAAFVLNIEEDKIAKNGNFQKLVGQNVPVNIYLHLMFAANFSQENYLEALRYISMVIEFFQSNPVFENSNTPMLSQNVDRVAMEFVNVDLQQLSNLWGNLGAKYVPSVVYKMKLLRFEGGVIREEIPKIAGGNLKKRTGALSNLLKAGATAATGAALNDALKKDTEE